MLHSLCCCCILILASASSSSSSSSSSRHGKTAAAATATSDKNGEDLISTILDRSSKHQDAYISASPLSVAAVCSDGIALVSLHFGLELNGDADQQKLLPSSGDGEKKGIDERIRGLFHDLPLSSRGPLRIEPIHDNGATMTSACPLRSPPAMALLTAGWRTDGMALSDAARELIMEETSLYCLPLSVTMGTSSSSSEDDAAISNNGQPSYYGRRLADGLSYYMAKCAFSEGVRSLSTIGLLACNRCLYLIDATGSYRVRAHAIGNGASTIHKRLVFVDFEDMTCIEGLRTLLQIIAEESGMLSSSVKASSENASSTMMSINDEHGNHECVAGAWTIPQNPGVELAVLKSCEQRMRRIRLSSLFHNQDQPGKVIE